MSDVSFEVVNVVAFAALGKSIEFSKVASALEGVKIFVKQFPGIVYSLRNPETMILIFESGKVVCTGAKSIEDSIKAINIVVDEMRTVNRCIPLEFEVKVVNIVASVDFGKMFDNLRRAALDFENTEYTPELFQGVVYRLDNPKLTFLLFSSGKLVCTGAKTMDDVKIGISKIKERLYELGLI